MYTPVTNVLIFSIPSSLPLLNRIFITLFIITVCLIAHILKIWFFLDDFVLSTHTNSKKRLLMILLCPLGKYSIHKTGPLGKGSDITLKKKTHLNLWHMKLLITGWCQTHRLRTMLLIWSFPFILYRVLFTVYWQPSSFWQMFAFTRVKKNNKLRPYGERFVIFLTLHNQDK